MGAAGLTVAIVDPDSAASESGIRVGDAIVQVNAVVPTTCGEWARAVREARHDRKALLVLVRREAAEVPLALGSAVWSRAVVVAPEPPPPPPPAEPPSVRDVVTAPPPPLPPETEVSLDEVTRELAALAPADRPPTRLPAYQKELALIRQKTDALAARGAAPAPVIGALRTVIRYYVGARVAWESEEAVREREHRPAPRAHGRGGHRAVLHRVRDRGRPRRVPVPPADRGARSEPGRARGRVLRALAAAPGTAAPLGARAGGAGAPHRVARDGSALGRLRPRPLLPLLRPLAPPVLQPLAAPLASASDLALSFRGHAAHV